MANGLDVKVRDYGKDIAADDPLMELSRIMGFDRAAPEVESVDPQLAIEDSFSMDLERELAFEDAEGVKPSHLDAVFNADFEDELSEAMQLADEAPSVVPSLEDELTALLGTETQPEQRVEWASEDPPITAAAAQPEPQGLEFEDELDLPMLKLSPPSTAPASTGWQDEDGGEDEIRAEAAEPWLDEGLDEPVDTQLSADTGPLRPEAVASFEPIAAPDELESFDDSQSTELAAAQAELDDAWRNHGPAVTLPVTVEIAAAEISGATTDDEPWLDRESGGELTDSAVQSEAVYHSVPEKAAPADWVLNEMDRVAVAAPVADFSLDEVSSDENDASVDDFDFDFEPEEALSALTAEINIDDSEPAVAAPDFETDMWQPTTEAAQPSGRDFGRMLAGTAPEPVVAAAEPMQDAVAQTDDFDIPDFDFNPEPKQTAVSAGALDDFEPDYAGYEPKVEKKTPSPIDEIDSDFEAILNEQWAAGNSAAASGIGAVAGVVAASVLRPNVNQPLDDDLDFQPFGGNAPSFPEAGFDPPAPRRSSWLVPSFLAGVVILSGGMYYAFSGGSSSATANGPVLVKADLDPVKIAPANPGGKSVPDQDKAVYDKVDGEQAALPSQGTLVSESEEPVDIASVAPDAPVEAVAANDGNAKSEARVDADASADAPASGSADTAAVSPKKVRTFIVKPDGSLVERPADAAIAGIADEPVATPVVKPVEDAAVAKVTPAQGIVEPVAEVATPGAVAAKPAIVVPEAKPVAVAKQAPATKTVVANKTLAAAAKSAEPSNEAIAALAAAEPAAIVAAPVEAQAAKPAPAIKVVKTKKIKAPAAEKVAEVAAQDGGAPVLESRPADQPVTIVGKTGGQKAVTEETLVASADPAPAPAAGSYSIQIASTPSPEAAKSTYAALSRKFGGVIGGKGVNILKAEVDGKGTVYRVRIPAGSKQAATSMCAKYKSSGGNCFVTK